MTVYHPALGYVKITQRIERACKCVHMLDGFACGNMPEAQVPDRICPIVKGERDRDYCPFTGFYAYRAKGN